jgi:hypothetical protein
MSASVKALPQGSINFQIGNDSVDSLDREVKEISMKMKTVKSKSVSQSNS